MQELGFQNGRQMYLDQRQKTSICFCNFLCPADIKDYNELHNRKRYSRVKMIMQDYSKGTGDKSVYAHYNLDSLEVKDIQHIASSIYPLYPQMEFGKKFFKAFGNKYCQLDIYRNPKMKNPWGIILTNGDVDKNKKPVSTISQIKQSFTDDLFYKMWTDVKDKVTYWEMYHAMQLFKVGEPLTAQAEKEYRNSQKVAENRNNGNYSKGYQSVPNRSMPQNNQRQNNVSRQNSSSQSVRNNVLPPPIVMPPAIPENEIPFEQTAPYGSGYGLRK